MNFFQHHIVKRGLQIIALISYMVLIKNICHNAIQRNISNPSNLIKKIMTIGNFPDIVSATTCFYFVVGSFVLIIGVIIYQAVTSALREARTEMQSISHEFEKK